MSPALTGATRVYGVIGDPVSHSLSPLMQNRALAALGIDAVYVPFHVKSADLADAIRGMAAFGMGGLNVTVPHKTAVIPLLDELSPTAQVVGAVNVILVRDGRLIGDSTDGYGFDRSLREGAGIDRYPERVCILGAGGAARSIAHACATAPGVSDIIIVNRTVEKAQTLAATMVALTGTRCTGAPSDAATLASIIPECGLVVNTTTVGMHPADTETPVPDPAVFHRGQIVCDIVYSPLRTRFLREAQAAGVEKTIGGLGMLAWQGARALELWTGREAPGALMLATLEETVAGKPPDA